MALEKVASAISKDKVIPEYLFQGQWTGKEIRLNHNFGLDAVLVLSNEFGDSLTIDFKGLRKGAGLTWSAELWQDVEADVVAYHFMGKIGGEVKADVWCYFAFGVQMDGVKIKITGRLESGAVLEIPLSALKHKVAMMHRIFWSCTEDEMGDILTGVGFRWADFDRQGISWRFDEANKKLLVNVSSTFELDPSTVGTSTVAASTNNNPQRKCFYANGRFWAFYSDGTNVGFRSSTDGINWSGFTSVGSGNAGRRIAVHFDGTYVHYCREATDLFYRRGTPNSDGTITWSATEQTAVDVPSGQACENPSIVVDSNGYAYIAYRWNDGTNYYPYITKNANTDGTWSTASGYPLQLSTISDSTWQQLSVSLTSSRVYVIYCRNGQQALGKLYTGSWGNEETVSSSAVQAIGINAVNEGDHVHFVFLKSTTNDIIYIKRTYGSGWGSEVTVQSSTTGTSNPCLSIDANNVLYCFWAGSPTANHIYYKKCAGGTWDANPTDWIDESTDGITNYGRLSCYYKEYGGKIGLIYSTKTASPYNVRHDYLAFISATDTGSGLDGPALQVSLTVSELGNGMDSPALEAQLSLAESGVGSEILGMQGTLTIQEGGSGIDSPTLEATVSLLDDGVGADISVLEAAVKVTETGSGIDTLQFINIPLTDGGVATETASLEAALPVSDQGIGSETPSLEAQLSLLDSGIGVETAFGGERKAVKIIVGIDGRVYLDLGKNLLFQLMGG